MAKVIEFSPVPDSFEKLNAEQREAVLHGEGPLLVVAGAGTGKTRVITERIRYLLESNPELAGESILGLTFTEKAAAEMKARVVKAVGERGNGVWLGTFHGFCKSMLTEQRPDLRVLDEYDHWILLRRNMPLLGLQIFKRLAEPGKFLNDFVKFFSRCQDELVTPDDYQQHAETLRAAYEREKDKLDSALREEREQEIARQEEIARAYRASEKLLRERKFHTFGALLLEAVRELRSNAELLRWQRERYRYLLVDEFQDTNFAQIELLWLLAGDRRNIVAVGDDDQAIYRFRGASFGSFKLFAEKFTGKTFAPGDAQTPAVKLVRNYRSTKRILRVAGQTIAQNADRIFRDKQLETKNDEGQHIVIAEFAGSSEEAHWIAGEIERLHRESHPWWEFAVLFRAHAHRDELVKALVRRSVPFVIKNLSILGYTLVRDIIAHLRLIVTPSDDVACARALACPAWRLGAADLVRLTQRTSHSRGHALWDVLRQAQNELPFPGKETRIAEFIEWISGLRNRAKALTAVELLDELLADLLGGLALTGLPTPADRRAVERFRKFVEEWEPKSETQRVREFVEYLEYYREAGGLITHDEDTADDAVQLMTVHAAKGLEFEHVFVMRLSRNAFPVGRRRRVLEFPAKLMKEALPEGDYHIQEERRLFYVALTRARKRLTLTTVVNKRSKNSPFLEDILMEPTIQRRDVRKIAPTVELPPVETPEREARRRLFGQEELDSRAYSRITSWAATFHPPVSEPLQLSASAVETYQQCPQKYLLQQMWGVRGGPQAALTFGSVMHNTIRHFVDALKMRRVTWEDVRAIYEREWSAAGFEDAYQEEEYRRAGLEQLEAFHQTYTAAPPDVLHQERMFELPLEHNVVVVGRMDQINRVGPKQVEIVDYKTGRPREESDAKKSLQLSMYALAARDALELDPVRLTFYNLTSNEPVSVSHDEKQLDRALADVQQAAAGIRAGHFPAQAGYPCGMCDFEPVCPAHEPLVVISPAKP